MAWSSIFRTDNLEAILFGSDEEQQLPQHFKKAAFALVYAAGAQFVVPRNLTFRQSSDNLAAPDSLLAVSQGWTAHPHL